MRPLAYHDVSAGGLIVCALEMGFAGNCGVRLELSEELFGMEKGSSVNKVLFAEEAGVLLEVPRDAAEKIQSHFEARGVCSAVVGSTVDGFEVNVSFAPRNGASAVEVLSSDIRDLRDTWEETSFRLERFQAEEHCVDAEETSLRGRRRPTYELTFTPAPTTDAVMAVSSKPKVAIIREEGSNGDREMSAAFYMAGFDPWDVHTNDIASGRVSLDDFRGAVFVGGFSYADVLDSAKGWAGVVRFREQVRAQFDRFYAREDTFSLGVCNGCQLMALLGIVPFGSDALPASSQPRFVHNNSGRYESRFVTVAIGDSPSIMLRGMAGSRLGVWVAHGEGRAFFPDQEVFKQIQSQRLQAVSYVDDAGDPTEAYPFNPNGSAGALAGLCSPDGRHLAMMPHPERAVVDWQWPYVPEELREIVETSSPWLTMFQNARAWCDENA